MPKTRVLIADDHAIVREGLATVIGRAPDMSVVALVADGEAAISALGTSAPHVAVVDMRMPRLGGISAIKRLHQRDPGLKIVVLSMYDDEHYVKAAFVAGAHGYVSKRAGSDALLHAIRGARDGSRIVHAPSRGEEPADMSETLSVREREVARMAAQGLTGKEMAERLGISKSSVDTYRTRVFQKLGVDNRAELVQRVASWANDGGGDAS